MTNHSISLIFHSPGRHKPGFLRHQIARGRKQRSGFSGRHEAPVKERSTCKKCIPASTPRFYCMPCASGDTRREGTFPSLEGGNIVEFRIIHGRERGGIVKRSRPRGPFRLAFTFFGVRRHRYQTTTEDSSPSPPFRRHQALAGLTPSYANYGFLCNTLSTIPRRSPIRYGFCTNPAAPCLIRSSASRSWL